MQTILIIEPDSHFAHALAQEIKRIGPATISTVPAVREACLILAQRAQDIAFLPATEEAPTFLHALRALQPTLPVVLTLPVATTAVAPNLATQIQGTLAYDQLNHNLRQVLAEASHTPYYSYTSPETAVNRENGQLATAVVLDTSHIQTALAQIRLGRLTQTIVVAQDSQIVASRGKHNEQEIRYILAHSHTRWDQEKYPTHLQFVQLPPTLVDVLLYSSLLGRNHHLILVAQPGTSLSELRLRADKLTAVLRGSMPTEPDGQLSEFNALADEEATYAAERVSYSIAWRSINPLPERFHIPLRRMVQRLANENGCILTFISIMPQLVHLNISCPAQRRSDWIAYLLKNGSEGIIQKEYHISTSLWEMGYYATESSTSLTDAELNLLLERTPPSPSAKTEV